MAFHQSLKAILAASCLFASLASAETTNLATLSKVSATPTGIRASSYIGCFATTVPFVNHGPYIYQASGNCQQICYYFQNSAMGLGNGTDCWCGDAYPPQQAKVDDTQCNTTCAGYPLENCGGAGAMSVYNTGFTLNQVQYWVESSSSTTSSASLASGASASASTSSSSGGGHSNTVGIVVGVIVGIIGLSAIAGAGFFFLRRRQQQEMDEYSRESNVKSFMGGASTTTDNSRPQMWAPDNRMDTTAGRRISNGSIADNEDFSRRILQVRNPDNGF